MPFDLAIAFVRVVLPEARLPVRNIMAFLGMVWFMWVTTFSSWFREAVIVFILKYSTPD